MNNPVAKLATYQDLLALPEPIVGDIIHGQLITHPRPVPWQAVACSSIGFSLAGLWPPE